MLTRQQKLAGFLQSELFLISQGAEACHGQEVAMQACAAHAAGTAQGVDAKLDVVVIAYPRNGSADTTQCAIGLGDLAQQSSLGTLQETIKQLPFDHGAEHRDVGGRVEQ